MVRCILIGILLLLGNGQVWAEGIKNDWTISKEERDRPLLLNIGKNISDAECLRLWRKYYAAEESGVSRPITLPPDCPEPGSKPCPWQVQYVDLCLGDRGSFCFPVERVSRLNEYLKNGWELMSPYQGATSVYLKKRVCE